MTIHVTQEHIDRGIPGSCSKCVVALAVLQANPAADSVSVGPTYIRVYHSRRPLQWTDYKTPAAARRLMTDFDCGDPVSPTTIHLEEPVSTVTL